MSCQMHHHYIGGTVPVPPLVMVLQALYHHDYSGNTCSKLKKVLAFQIGPVLQCLQHQ
jgi:hypothetical protein